MTPRCAVQYGQCSRLWTSEDGAVGCGTSGFATLTNLKPRALQISIPMPPVRVWMACEIVGATEIHRKANAAIHVQTRRLARVHCMAQF